MTPIAMLLILASLLVGHANAATPPGLLTQFGEAGQLGQAGQLGGRGPTAIAVDPTTGHILVAGGEAFNTSRIDEFTAWGEFDRAFGWGVAPGAVNEQQEVRVRAAAGNFRLSFSADTTNDLPFNATGEEVATALNGLSTVAGGVSVQARVGSNDGTSPFVYIVTFSGGSFAGTDVPQLVATDGSVPLSGGSPATSLEVRTRADGTPGGLGLQACTLESACKSGAGGTGAGQLGPSGAFRTGRGISVAPDGSIYVFELRNSRVQKFSPDGHFLYMIGGEVNKTTKANLCTKEDIELHGDTCGAGIVGSGQGQFGVESTADYSYYNVITVGADGTLYAGDKNRIQEFNPDGSFKAEVPLPAPGYPGALTVDPTSGDLLFAFDQATPSSQVYKLDPATGAVVAEFKATFEGTSRPRYVQALAADAQGNVFVADGDPGKGTIEGKLGEVIEFSATGAVLIPPGSGFAAPVKHENGVGDAITSLATNSASNLIVSYIAVDSSQGATYIRIYGEPPNALEPPPSVPPTITSQFASATSTDSAVLKAQINPHYFKDTRYYLEYGLQPCSVGPCAPVPAAPGSLLTQKTTNAPVTTTGTSLADLAPGVTYYYRFVAKSGGGGPTFGEDRSFKTFTSPGPASDGCANASFRSGAAATLPDCRAYEMVSPVDKDNGDIKTPVTISSFTTSLNQSASSGALFTFSSFRSFGGAPSAPYASQYLAHRENGGWLSKPISPPRQSRSFYGELLSLESEFKFFSADLTNAWLLHDAEPILDSCAPEGYGQLYRRDSVSGTYQALSCAKPEHAMPFEDATTFAPEFQGASSTGDHAVFRVQDKLTENASDGDKYQVYESFGHGSVSLVSVLPDGVASAADASVGSTGGGSSGTPNRMSSVSNAISADGSRVFWSSEEKVYLRENAPEPPSVIVDGKCTEPSKACTIPVSEVASSKPAHFEAASPSGSKAIFTVDTTGGFGSSLFEFNVAKGKATLIAKGVLKSLLGASSDANRLYFASKEVLTDEENSEGKTAVAGEPNLYLYDSTRKAGERFVFIGSFLGAELAAQEVGPFVAPPVLHTARVSPDGNTALFTSTAPLTNYDNHDAVSGELDREVYRYAASQAGPGKLSCISCNPTGARPLGHIEQQEDASGNLPTAAVIPGASNQSYFSRALSDDGQRAFFNSYEALVPADTNGQKDVYQWEAAGTGSCTEARSSFVPASEGCVSLISTGRGDSGSEFLDASDTGDDVFFLTAQGLVPQDSGLYDVYDARVGGGFAPPPLPSAACEGEACQGLPSAPPDIDPASSNYAGPGNVTEVKRAGKHRTGHHKKSKARKHKRSAKASGRAHGKGSSR